VNRYLKAAQQALNLGSTNLVLLNLEATISPPPTTVSNLRRLFEDGIRYRKLSKLTGWHKDHLRKSLRAGMVVNTSLTLKELLEAVVQTDGDVALASKRLGLRPQRAYQLLTYLERVLSIRLPEFPELTVYSASGERMVQSCSCGNQNYLLTEVQINGHR